MRVDALDDLTVELQYETQYAVSRRMLGPEIEGEVAQGGFGHNGLGACARGARRPRRRRLSPLYRVPVSSRGCDRRRAHWPRKRHIDVAVTLGKPRIRHRIKCSAMGTKEGPALRDWPC